MTKTSKINDRKSVRKFCNLSQCPRNTQGITIENVRLFKTLPQNYLIIIRTYYMTRPGTKSYSILTIVNIYSILFRQKYFMVHTKNAKIQTSELSYRIVWKFRQMAEHATVKPLTIYMYNNERLFRQTEKRINRMY